RAIKRGTDRPMIAMLYSVATLLVVAGCAAVVYGADNIRADSGTAWLQSGATLAASGFLLIAVTAVLAELRRVRRQISEMAVEVQEYPLAPPAPPVVSTAGATAGLAAGALAAGGLAAAADHG